MNTCLACGTENSPASPSCSACGRPLSQTLAATAVATAAVSIWSAITNMPGTVIPTASLGMKK